MFLCRYWYFEDIGGICASFDFSRSKVESMLHRTREKLKRFLQKEELPVAVTVALEIVRPEKLVNPSPPLAKTVVPSMARHPSGT